MCNCGKPTINGQVGEYRWNNDTPSTYPINPPPLQDGDDLVYDEPGRCGNGRDSHSYHFRVVRKYGMFHLLVRHGGGDRRICLWSEPGIASLEKMGSDERYWMLCLIYSTQDK